MPFLAKLVAAGAAGPLRSTLPPVTAPAWSSFSTGKNPGKHGLFTWQRTLSSNSSHKREWVSSHNIQSDKIWHILGSAGLKVGILNVPMTYPPEAVNGFMVSGLLTPSPDSPFTYPPALREELFSLVPDYIIDMVDVNDVQATPDPADATDEKFECFTEQIMNAAHSRTTAAIKLVERYHPDFFMLVYVLPDRLQHASYHYLLTAANDPATTDRRAQASMRALASLDQELERLVTSVADKESLIILVSDHGFCHHRYDIYLNGWLADKGLLRYKAGSSSLRQYIRAIARGAESFIPQEWMHAGRKAFSAERLIDWLTTRAYCGQPTENGIYINLEGRRPWGTVKPEEYEPLRHQLRAELVGLVNPSNQEAVFQAIYFREEVYQGPYVDHAPDIVFEPQEGYRIVPTPAPSFYAKDVSKKRRGIHARDGIFIATGPMIRPAAKVANAGIADVAPTILYTIDLPIPETMDGQVMVDVFQGSYRKEIRYMQGEAEVVPRRSQVVYSDRDAAEIERRLANLGYLD
jgi:predicted AlkP superfamily phosphohydrolase/phosphomutase